MNELAFGKERTRISSRLHTKITWEGCPKQEERRYWILLTTLIALGLLASYGLGI